MDPGDLLTQASSLMEEDELDRLIEKMSTVSDYYIDKILGQGEPAARRLLRLMADRTGLRPWPKSELVMSQTIALHRLAKGFPDVILSLIQDGTVQLTADIALALRECGDHRLEDIAREALRVGHF